MASRGARSKPDIHPVRPESNLVATWTITTPAVDEHQIFEMAPHRSHSFRADHQGPSLSFYLFYHCNNIPANLSNNS